MKRVTIYVDEKDWLSVKESAWDARVSVGKYLMNLHCGSLARVGSVKPACSDKFESHKAIDNLSRADFSADSLNNMRDKVDAIIDRVPFNPQPKKGKK